MLHPCEEMRAPDPNEVKAIVPKTKKFIAA
jgi:hypothetical protein